MASLQVTLTMGLLLCVSGMCHARPLDGSLSSMDISQEDVPQWKLHFLCRLLAVALLIAGVALLLAFPLGTLCFVRILGFTATGIVAGSKAALIMSLYAGRVTVWSICAICQSVGALGVASLSVLWPIIGVCIILWLLSWGIECGRLGVWRAPGTHISGIWNTTVGDEVWNTIRSHASAQMQNITIGDDVWNTIHSHTSAQISEMQNSNFRNEVWNTIRAWASN